MKSAKIAFACLSASILLLAGCNGAKEPATPFKVGSDVATMEVEGHSEWAGTVTANVMIKADTTILFNGKVTVTSDSLYCSEFFKAACEEKSLSQNGLENGFVTSIGEYVNNDQTFTYWMWEYNGHNPTNFACNDVHVFDGDYMMYYYAPMAMDW